MKYVLLTILATFTFNAFSLDYPTSPNLQHTPGSLCDKPDTYRYPEHINYCQRRVSSHLKKEIFADYRDHLGFRLDPSQRSNYKIDHFFPLCAGGSNHQDNLWPQHASVYNVTDPMEGLGCEKLSQGKITQKDLIALIKRAKLDLTQAPQIIKQLKNL